MTPAAVAPAGHSYSDSLLGNAEAAAVVTRPKAKAKATSEELAVSKAIRDNFSELIAAELDLVQVEGLSLRDTLLRDKGLQRGGQLTMGKFYYESIKKKFLQTEDGHDNLKVQDTKQEVPEQLMAAMRLCLGKLKKAQPLQDWLEVMRGVGNKKAKTSCITYGVACIMNHCLKQKQLNPGSSNLDPPRCQVIVWGIMS